jgi:hypothetical protein
MQGSEIGAKTTKADLARFWQALHDGRVNCSLAFVAAGWQERGVDSAATAGLRKNQPNVASLAAKKPQLAAAMRDGTLNSGMIADSDDNGD